MIVVADASVAAKWFLASAPEEQEGETALQLLRSAVAGTVKLWQPPHFVAEVASVLARLKPEEALIDVRDLLDLEFEQFADEQVYAQATNLAIRLDHHLFDTLYHALALSATDATLVTADHRYFRKARSLGRIELLTDWTPV